ncbi:MFS transporter [Streptomyces lavendulae]|uniref:MFS transporter n=1 Tax=Streptomyces lavendulae TaxID=1914 RepID=UPI00382E4164
MKTAETPVPTATPGRASAGRALIVAAVVDAIGDGLFIVVSTLYYARVLNLSAQQVGSAFIVAGVLGLLTGIGVGRLADVRGPSHVYRTILVTQSLTAALLLLVDSFPLFVGSLTLIMCAERANRAVRGGLVARIATPDTRVKLRATIRAGVNLGAALGSLGGAVAVHLDTESAFRWAIAANALSYLVALALLTRLPRFTPLPRPEGIGRWTALRDTRYITVTGLTGVMTMNILVITVGLPLWIALKTEAPLLTIPAVFLINTLLVVALQRALSKGADSLRGAAAKSRNAGLMLLAACLLMPASGYTRPVLATVIILIAVVVHSLGSIGQAASAFGLSFELAPEHAISEYQGVFGLAAGIASAFGAGLVTYLCVEAGPVGWVVLGTLFAVTGAAMPPVVRWAAARPTQPPRPPHTHGGAR